MLTGLTKGGGGVGEMLTMADKGGRGGWGNADNGSQRGKGVFVVVLFDVVVVGDVFWLLFWGYGHDKKYVSRWYYFVKVNPTRSGLKERKRKH